MNYIVKIIEGKPVIYGMAGKDGKDAPVYVFEDEETFDAAFEAGMIPVGAVVIKTYDGVETAGGPFDDKFSEESENAPQNKLVTIHIKKQDEELEILSQIANGTYEGRNLADVFDSEIAKYTNAWEWMKDRIRTVRFQGLYVSDYIPINTSDGEEVKPQIAGIDTYYRTTDQNLGHHIDFISKDCLAQTIRWNDTNNNNGVSEAQPQPYMSSKVRKHLLETVYPKLPADVKAVISNKRFLLENRYSNSGLLTDSTVCSWVDIGNLWLPSEYEIFGSIVHGTKHFSGGQHVQYPLFANSYKHRVKRLGDGGNRCYWWLSTVYSDNSIFACNIDICGIAAGTYATGLIGTPLCFRIAQ